MSVERGANRWCYIHKIKKPYNNLTELEHCVPGQIDLKIVMFIKKENTKLQNLTL